jgi:hypothetical protein
MKLSDLKGKNLLIRSRVVLDADLEAVAQRRRYLEQWLDRLKREGDPKSEIPTVEHFLRCVHLTFVDEEIIDLDAPPATAAKA